MDSIGNIAQIGKKDALNVEIGAKLQMEIEGVDFVVSSVFIGMMINEFVIAAPPSRFVTIKEKLFQGNGVIVKYLSEGIVFAFQTRIIDLIKQPIKVIILEYPKLIQNHELRSLKRNECFLLATIEIGRIVKECVIRDISKRGCRCHIPVPKVGKNPYTLKTEVELKCKFPGLEETFSLKGKVKNIRQEGKFTSLGIKFDILPEKIQNVIAHYIFSTEDFTL